jgi:RNA polymerase primary sigma factor
MRELFITNSITNRDSGSLDRYFSDVKKFGRISKQEEEELALRIASGDIIAIDQLVSANLRFVISVAKQYQIESIPLCDLINEGNIGLIKAATRFDSTRGFKFITFAVWWVRQAIMAAIEEQSILFHVPAEHVAFKKKYTRAISKLEHEYGRAPLIEELAEYLKVPLDKVITMIKSSSVKISLDQPLASLENTTLLDLLHLNDNYADEIITKASIAKEIEFALTILTPREQDILKLYYGLNASLPVRLEEIALKLGLSVEHTRRLKDQSLMKLKQSSYAEILQSCLAN